MLFFAVIASKANAQTNRISWEYNYEHFGIENGLPSTETYQVYQDKSGLLWILTDKGVVRYDGFEFHKYTVENGMCDNVNFRVSEDENGAIWFVGYNGLLTIFKDGKMHPYKYNYLLRREVSMLKNTTVSIHVNKDGSIIYSNLQQKIFSVSNQGKLRIISDQSSQVGYFFDFGNEFVCFQGKYRNTNTPCFFVRDGKNTFAGEIYFSGSTRMKKHKGHYFVISARSLYFSYDKNFKVLPEKQQVISLDTDDRFIYVGLYKNGVKKYRFDSKTQELILIQHYLPNCSVSSAIKDINGSLWITTLENGVFVIDDEAFKQLAINGINLNEEVRFISGNKQKVIITHYVGKWQQLYAPYLYKDDGKILFRQNLLPYKDGFIYEKGDLDWSKWKDITSVYPVNPIYATDSSFFGIANSGIRITEFKKNSKVDFHFTMSLKHKVTEFDYWFYLQSYKKIFVLGNEGIFAIDINKNKLNGGYRAVLRKRFSQLKYNKVWGLLALSSFEGIYEIDQEREKAIKVPLTANIGEEIYSIFFDEKNRLWIASQEGLFLLVKKNGKVLVRSFLNKRLLSSSEVMDLYAYNGVAYLATKFGVQKIDFFKVKKEQDGCPLSVFSIQTFAKNKELHQGEIYSSKTDLIKISISNKNLNKHLVYRYRFGKDQTWIKSNKGEIIVNSPSNGDFNLEVSCLNLDNQWSKAKCIASFTVEKIIFARWYFILIYIGLLVLLFYMILKYSLKAANRKNHLLNRMVELERMALSAQMNPHFIFNSLNSIHSFLLYEENENAEKYLLRFAKLIRQTLANSRESYITIEEECETLKNYLLLETMRFKNAFTFHIECDLSKLPHQSFIPPMLIQPYVENAILHGLSKKSGDGELLLRFYLEDDLLKVLIEDNGIGYFASKKEKKDSKHKSYGTQITEERLKSLQGKNSSYNVSIEVVDSSNLEFPGTRVIVTIPININ